MEDQRRETFAQISALLRNLFWLGHRQTVETMESAGLTLPQAMVLLGLEASGGRSPMAALGRMVQQTPATMTGIVDRLIGLGLVDRLRAEDDRRVVNVALTDAGRERVALINARRDDDTAAVTAALSDAELAQFGVMLERMVAAMAAMVYPQPPHAGE